MTYTCPICCEERNTSIKCPNCKVEICKICTQKYLLGSTTLSPKCMNCNEEWDIEFLGEVTGTKFFNEEYRLHRTKLLLSREKSLLPATMSLAREEQDKTTLEQKIHEQYQLIHELRTQMNNAERELRALKRKQKFHVWDIEYNQDTKVQEVKYKYMAHCPIDNCNGYVGDDWKCGLCGQKTCKKCFQAKEKEHTCDDDDIATAKLLKKDTKPCPNCCIPIHRIDGCMQMWCPSCHKAFDWKTGQIEKGRIHNPHYYQYLREHKGHVPREIGDGGCGGYPDYKEIQRVFKFDPIPYWLTEAHRNLGEILAIEMPRYRTTLEPNSYLELRVKFLLNMINEKKWLTELKRREKLREKTHSIYLVIQMYTQILGTLMNNIVIANSMEEIESITDEMHKLRDYTNESFKKIGLRYNNKYPFINDNWKFIMHGTVPKRRRIRYPL